MTTDRVAALERAREDARQKVVGQCVALVQGALDDACTNCRKGDVLLDHPRGGIGHLVSWDGAARRRWYRCGRDDYNGRRLEKLLAAIRALVPEGVKE